MAAAVRAVIVEAHSFSGIAKLHSEDGRSLVLTRHASGSEEVQLREGAWLTCEVAGPAPFVLAVRTCSDPSQRQSSPGVHPAPPARPSLLEIARGKRTIHTTQLGRVLPVVWLSTWQVFELPSGSRHVWGRDDAAGEGRVSSMLSTFHPATGTLRSISGRTYKLVGPPKVDMEREYVWLLWLSLQHVKLADVRPVSAEVWGAVRSSAGDHKRLR